MSEFSHMQAFLANWNWKEFFVSEQTFGRAQKVPFHGGWAPDQSYLSIGD
jgi:hypothetical protein